MNIMTNSILCHGGSLIHFKIKDSKSDERQRFAVDLAKYIVNEKNLRFLPIWKSFRQFFPFSQKNQYSPVFSSGTQLQHPTDTQPTPTRPEIRLLNVSSKLFWRKKHFQYSLCLTHKKYFQYLIPVYISDLRSQECLKLKKKIWISLKWAFYCSIEIIDCRGQWI